MGSVRQRTYIWIPESDVARYPAVRIWQQKPLAQRGEVRRVWSVRRFVRAVCASAYRLGAWTPCRIATLYSPTFCEEICHETRVD